MRYRIHFEVVAIAATLMAAISIIVGTNQP